MDLRPKRQHYNDSIASLDLRPQLTSALPHRIFIQLDTHARNESSNLLPKQVSCTHRVIGSPSKEKWIFAKNDTLMPALRHRVSAQNCNTILSALPRRISAQCENTIIPANYSVIGSQPNQSHASSASSDLSQTSLMPALRHQI